MTGDPTRVRIADERDEDALLEICHFVHGENGLFAFSEERVHRQITGAIRGSVGDRTGLAGVIGEYNALQGAILISLGQEWYSDDWQLQELFSYVYPQYRSTPASQDLLAFADQIQARFGIPLVIGVLSNQRTEAKVRLIRKQFGPACGAFFVRGATTGQGVN